MVGRKDLRSGESIRVRLAIVALFVPVCCAARGADEGAWRKDFAVAEAIIVEVETDAAGQRLDQWLAGRLGAGLSRSRVQALIRQGAVSLDGRPLGEGKPLNIMGLFPPCLSAPGFPVACRRGPRPQCGKKREPHPALQK